MTTLHYKVWTTNEKADMSIINTIEGVTEIKEEPTIKSSTDLGQYITRLRIEVDQSFDTNKVMKRIDRLLEEEYEHFWFDF